MTDHFSKVSRAFAVYMDARVSLAEELRKLADLKRRQNDNLQAISNTLSKFVDDVHSTLSR